MRLGGSRVLAVRPDVFGGTLALPVAAPASRTSYRLDGEPVIVAERNEIGDHGLAMLQAAGKRGQVRGAKDIDDGSLVAVVAIDGPLSHRGEQHPCGFVDGYDWISDRVTGALADPKVGAVVLRINSPGGDVAGLEESVRRMREAATASGKHVEAHVDELAASAAYWIAAGVADHITVPPMGQVGSIGTIGAWVDARRAYADAGFDVHVIRDPAGKAEANPAAPVAEVADERLLELVTESTRRFIGAMAARRPMTETQLRALNGALRHGQAAVNEGLADALGSFEDAITAAATAAETRRQDMAGSKALRALGLSDGATDEDIVATGQQRAADAALAATARELAGGGTDREVAGRLTGWRQSAQQVTELSARVAEQDATAAKRELAAYLSAQIGSRLTPASAWAKGEDGAPIAGEPASEWAKLGLDGAKALVAVLPPLAMRSGSTAPQALTGAGALSERELAKCREKNIDPAAYAANKAALEARTARS